MQHNFRTRNPTELLIELRRRVDQADCKLQLADSLAHLLAQLNAPVRLPGLLRIAENILAILEQGSGVPIPENMNSRVAGWKDALTWITSNSDGIATETFLVPADKERFGRTTDPNPVLRQGAISSPIYCQLWEVHPRPEYKDQFRILQGHLMFAQFDVREKINSAACPYTSEEKRVAHDRLYRTTYPLQQIASMQTIGFAGGIVRRLFASIQADLPRGTFAEELWRYRGKFTAENSELRDCLSALVRQLDWSLNSSYHPEPRPEANDGDQNSGVSDPTPFTSGSQSSDSKPPAGFDSIQPTRDLDEPSRRSAYTVSSRLEEFDELDDIVFRGDDEGDTSRRTTTNIFRHTKESAEYEAAQQILATGDYPGNYLLSDSTDLAENARGVLLDSGGWKEMRNQYLPWSLSELADEELADAWQRLERHAQTLEPVSVELFALVIRARDRENHTPSLTPRFAPLHPAGRDVPRECQRESGSLTGFPGSLLVPGNLLLAGIGSFLLLRPPIHSRQPVSISPKLPAGEIMESRRRQSIPVSGQCSRPPGPSYGQSSPASRKHSERNEMNRAEMNHAVINLIAVAERSEFGYADIPPGSINDQTESELAVLGYAVALSDRLWIGGYRVHTPESIQFGNYRPHVPPSIFTCVASKFAHVPDAGKFDLNAVLEERGELASN